MKNNKDILALLALSLSLGLPVVEALLCALFEEENLRLSSEASQTVYTAKELQNVIRDPKIKRIVLGTDIITSKNLVFERDVIIDLDGYKLASLNNDARVIDVRAGNLMITGKGSIVANGQYAAAVRVRGALSADNLNFASVLIDEQVTLYAPNYYGLFVTPNFRAAYGVRIDFRGAMVAYHGICINGEIQGKGDNAPQINIIDGARIMVDENDGVAISASGYGHWELGAAEIIGANGIEMRCGHLTCLNTTIVATGAGRTVIDGEENIGGTTFYFEPMADLDLQLKLKSGTYLSRQSYVFLQGADVIGENECRLQLQGGDYIGENGVLHEELNLEPQRELQIVGGNFSHDVAQYLTKKYYTEYDQVTGLHRIYSKKQSITLDDEKLQLVRAKGELEMLVEEIDYYLSEEYAGQELGDWQADIDRALAGVNRAKKAAEKVLFARQDPLLEQIQTAIRRVRKAVLQLETIEDELRTEIIAAITAAREIEVGDYSNYSYRILMESVEDADIILARNQISFQELYSAFCDVSMNLDLLDDPEEDDIKEDFVVAKVAPKVEPEVVEAEPVVDPRLEAARKNLQQLLNELQVLDYEQYTIESLRALWKMTRAAHDLLAEDDEEISVDLLVATYQQVEEAHDALILKADDPVLRALDEARTNLYEVVEAVQQLTLRDYRVDSAEQFGELQVAIAKAQSVLDSNATELDPILEVMEMIQNATTGLKVNETKSRTVTNVIDWTKLSHVIAQIGNLHAQSYTTESYARLLQQLETTKTIFNNPKTTQQIVDNATMALNAAMANLVASPTPASVYENALLVTPETDDVAKTAPSNLFMSLVAGAYSGLTTYRRQRMTMKHRKS